MGINTEVHPSSIIYAFEIQVAHAFRPLDLDDEEGYGREEVED
jgi:hypothetical protein